MSRGTLVTTFIALVAFPCLINTQVLTPPYFNLAEGRLITSSATCGYGVSEPELYCKLVGAHADLKDNPNVNIIQGQVCDYCDPSNPELNHSPQHAIDGTEKWWQSPPLSRGNSFNEVNLTIDLGQEFHVAYVFIKMANSPRPGIWALERSTDHGETWKAWQYFADNPNECRRYFGLGGQESSHITADDSVTCETRFSTVVPLEGGEIVVSLLHGRPNAENFYNSTVLQDWTKATNIRLRFLRTKTLLGHLMSVARQDPTVTRRYYYSVRDISIGGRCVCNGHADTCDITDPNDLYKLLCRCQHNTCGAQCEFCCPGFVQKKWRAATTYAQNECEPCNCFEHSYDCEYDEETDRLGLSLDIHNQQEGGGVCQHCQHNTEGINCNRCKPGYFRPYGKPLNATDVCHPCNCDIFYSTGACFEGNGICECRQEFLPPNCDDCNYGYYGYPNCRPCDCHLNGTRGQKCEVGGGQCPCKTNYRGKNCDQCAEGYFNFPECLPCDCNLQGSVDSYCDIVSGQCSCRTNYGGRTCADCDHGFYGYPDCVHCGCDETGCAKEICNKTTGSCICKEGFGGPRCSDCSEGYYGKPNCKACNCNLHGSVGPSCDGTGKCSCLVNYGGLQCTHCTPGYYQYPECKPCNCNSFGSVGVSCDDDGRCTCRSNFDGINCDRCREGFYNFPACEECNCDPAGVLPTFAGCANAHPGELCQCKERVTGRICNQCKPLYWNLKATNPDGCEDCGCHLPGTVGGINVCNGETGQCFCKPNTGSRKCEHCRDGTYDLQQDNLFGCVDCGCDIGGSISKVCDKSSSGQCSCQPRIEGRTCNEPTPLHYFPSLYQLQYELEDGHTPNLTPVRYGYSDHDFPDYSWRGYAIFSPLQKEVQTRVHIERPSLYRVVVRYINPNHEDVVGFVVFIPDHYGDTRQSSAIRFEPTRGPKLLTVSGKENLIPSHFVINPGRWTISFKIDKSIYIDYFVLLPAAYYEATLLQENVNIPCKLGTRLPMCIHYLYPELSDFKSARGERGYVVVDGEKLNTQLYTNFELLDELEIGDEMALLDANQREMQVELVVPKAGRYALVVLYTTPKDGKTVTIHIETTSTSGRDKGRVILHECLYSMLCRQAVTDPSGRVAMFNFESNNIIITISGNEAINVAIDSIVAIPRNDWSLDYIDSKPSCVRRDGMSIEGQFQTIPGMIKVEMETDEKFDKNATTFPSTLLEHNVGLVYLDHKDVMVDIRGNVPHAGFYVFVVHYYQPKHPVFNLEVVIQDGQSYEAILPVPFCPSVSGCRSVVRDKSGDIQYQIIENWHMTIRETNHKSVWLDYILAIPAEIYKAELLKEMPLDRTNDFIAECGKNQFFIEPSTTGKFYTLSFCRDATFSLTAEYNHGGLRCHCTFEGSENLYCDAFGGQCQCKLYVIGRTCSQCRTGYFGYPDCHPCNCPSTAVCDQVTGDCICPPRVTGEYCDTCLQNTYGFDPIIGCEDCNCNPLGVENGNLQCDLFLGECDCKVNIVGRTCSSCKPGYWSFPFCQLCNCDFRGTTEDICDMDNAYCFCKENVIGPMCDTCKPSTYYLQENNLLGCTKCFCFGKSDRCNSATWYRTQVFELNGWENVVFLQPGTINVEVPNNYSSVLTTQGVKVELQDAPIISGNVLYFSAPNDYLGNKIVSYGGVIRYTISFTMGDKDGAYLFLPDVILVGNNMTIIYEHEELPSVGSELNVEVLLLETHFHTLSGVDITREQFMVVLHNLEKIYIRGEYFTGTREITLELMMMDIAVAQYFADSAQALSVEQCLCPQNYQGLSCEECAKGYYRSQQGPYGGYCVPCQCHGHADSCDPITGKCFNCKYNTTGDHCETCVEGFHGDATIGSPYDCFICACPHPTMSNNFAKSCEFSPLGNEIHCECKEGYFGPQCSFCAAGYYGRPNITNEYCKPCECNNNIDSSSFGACDSLTGECVQCLNNTFGAACEICAPDHFGDAVELKNCKNADKTQNLELKLSKAMDATVFSNVFVSFAVIWAMTRSTDGTNKGISFLSSLALTSVELTSAMQHDYTSRTDDRRYQPRTRRPTSRTRRPFRGGITTRRTYQPRWRSTTVPPRGGYVYPGCYCDNCGTRECHHATGICTCKDNVIGEKCDECAKGFYGFDKCRGCSDCACSEASESSQCDINSGQCKCRPGVTGRTCEHCLSGYYDFNAFGCRACHCNQNFSVGGSCNPQTGQCECLPGVIGERCDRCPHRWVLIPDTGCRVCDECVHFLLDDVDTMTLIFEKTYTEIKSASVTFFAFKRIDHFNKTVNELRPIVDLLNVDPSAINFFAFNIEITDLESDISVLDKSSEALGDEALGTSIEAEKVKNDAIDLEKMMIEIASMAAGIVEAVEALAHTLVAGKGPDVDRKIKEAEKLLEDIRKRDFSIRITLARTEGHKSNITLDRAIQFAAEIERNRQREIELKERFTDLDEKLRDLLNNSQNALYKANKAKTLYDENKLQNLKSRIAAAEEVFDDIKKMLAKGNDLIILARELLAMARVNFETITDHRDKLDFLTRLLRDKIDQLVRELRELPVLVRQAEQHAQGLMQQARSLASLLLDTQLSSENAVRAANSYNEIVSAINEALSAAEAAIEASNDADGKAKGIDENAIHSKEISLELFRQAEEAAAKVEPGLRNRLNDAKREVNTVQLLNKQTSDGLGEIERSIARMNIHGISDAARNAMSLSEQAQLKVEMTMNNVDGILTKIDDDKIRAEKIPREINDAQKAIARANTQIPFVLETIPKIKRLMDRLGNKSSALRILGTDVADKIAALKLRVALARDRANRIRLGVDVRQDAAIQVRNPDRLSDAATHNTMSLYFRTTSKNGFLAYLGNEIGTHERIRRTKTDDFMALGLENGRVVLAMDMGSGAVREYSSKSLDVSQDRWHQVIVERTGKSVTLTVRTEGQDDDVNRFSLPGSHAVFNLDQEYSRFYVGGVLKSAKIQSEVRHLHFDGEIEEITFNNNPIGIWNFVAIEGDVDGCIERDSLVIVTPSSALRFDGSGYTIMKRRSVDRFAQRVEIVLQFKTYAREGLLFLIGKEADYFAIELRDGRIVFQFELGSGVLSLKSNDVLNDGEWHSVQASRIKREARLMIDSDTLNVGIGTSPGHLEDLSFTDDIFIGGYPGNHTYKGVTNMDFEGCIDGFQVGSSPRNLNDNKEALGVVTGCPEKIARTVSFTEDSTGYLQLKLPFHELTSSCELTFKFKTIDENGLLFYMGEKKDDKSNSLSLSIHNGAIVFKTIPGGEVRTPAMYNDQEWHFVTATRQSNELLLDIDDFDHTRIRLGDRKDFLISSKASIFVGGPGTTIIENATPTKRYFIGCVGDVTINGEFLNFANSSYQSGGSLANCPIADPKPTPIAIPIDIYPVTVYPPEIKTDRPTQPPKFYTTERPRQCALPRTPLEDLGISEASGIRFGVGHQSRQEYSVRPSEFAKITHLEVQFQTKATHDGILFYLADKENDFAGLTINGDGMLKFSYNLGSGSTNVESGSGRYNDGKWHTVNVHRNQRRAKLTIDGKLVGEGSSNPPATTMEMVTTLFVGGVSDGIKVKAKAQLRGVDQPFDGCLRRLKIANRPAEEPRANVGTQSCSDKVEPGSFFSDKGGHLILHDNFVVGTDLDISLEIKPRDISGVIMAIHGQAGDYLALQLLEGSVKFSIDNGAGQIQATYTPSDKFTLCDGNWHKIQAVKSKNIIMLSVDDHFVDPAIGRSRLSLADTNDPLHFGGVPHPSRTKGIETTKQFIGCIRNVEFKKEKQNLSLARSIGNVTLNVCPTT
uniref:Laminin subunit alpha n=1 Tax=Strigamia maritima TaxID=126957 RepID=T1J097_STRMM